VCVKRAKTVFQKQTADEEKKIEERGELGVLKTKTTRKRRGQGEKDIRI